MGVQESGTLVPSGTSGSKASLWLEASVILAAATAASAYLGIGVFASTDAPMFFAGLTVLTLAAACLESREPSSITRTGAALLISALALVVVSALFSDFTPFALFGSPRVRLGLLAVVPLGLSLVLARAFSLEIGRALARLAPWVFVAWALAVAWQFVTDAPMLWGLSSNGAISAQVLLLLLPSLLALADRAGAVARLTVGAGVTGMLWAVDSRLGVALALTWIVFDALVIRRVTFPAWRRVVAWLPVGHVAISAGLVAAVVGAGLAPPALGTRPSIWRSALDVGLNWWLVGAGPDSFPHVAARHVTLESAYIEGDSPLLAVSAHNIWIDMFAHYGVLGVALMFVAGVYIARRWATGGPAEHPFRAGVVLFSATLILQPLTLQTIPLASMVLLASMPRFDRGAGPTRIIVRPRRALPLIALPLSLLLILYAGTCIVVGRPDYRPAGAQVTQAAAKLWQYDPELWAQTAYRHGMDIATSSDPAATVKDMEASLGRAIELVPAEPRYRYELARSSELLGLDDQIVSDRYDAALAVYPLSPEILSARGLFRARSGDLDAARTAYSILQEAYPYWRGTAEYGQQLPAFDDVGG